MFGLDENTQPRKKYLLKENLMENFASILYYGGSDDALLSNFGIPFDNPKPVYISKRLIQSLCKSGEIVLDFFAGSGTTMQAVMELNLEDGGSRQCICVQIPERLEENTEAYKAGYRTISNITRARIDKVIEKLKAEQPEKTQDLACAQFTLAPSHFKQWRSDVDGEALREQLEMFQQSEKSAPQIITINWATWV